MEDIQYEIGDIVLAPFPFVDSSVVKNRPALVFSTLPHNVYLVAYITSAKEGITDFDVQVEPNQINNLKVASHVRVNRLIVVDGGGVYKKLGELSCEKRKEVAKKVELMQKGILCK